MVHARQYEGRMLELEMTGSTGAGKVRDRGSRLLWSQTSGKGYQGQKPLVEIPSVMQTWGEWRKEHPKSELVLTPAILEERVDMAVVSAHVLSISGIVAAARAIGRNQLTPLPLLVMSSALLALAAMLRRRQAVALDSASAERSQFRVERCAPIEPRSALERRGRGDSGIFSCVS